MSEMKDNVIGDVDEILGWKVQVEKAQQVPKKDALTLGGTAQEFKAAVMFVDVRNSSSLTDAHRRATTMKIYNAFLNGTIRIVRANKGHIRSFTGDGILAFFDPTVGNPPVVAVRTAKQILYFVRGVLRPALKQRKYADEFAIGIGITYGTIVATRVGIKGEENNAMVWPARAVNLASKLSSNREYPDHICVEKAVFEALPMEMRRPVSSWDYFWQGAFWEKTSFKFAGEWTDYWKSKLAEEF